MYSPSTRRARTTQTTPATSPGGASLNRNSHSSGAILSAYLGTAFRALYPALRNALLPASIWASVIFVLPAGMVFGLSPGISTDGKSLGLLCFSRCTTGAAIASFFGTARASSSCFCLPGCFAAGRSGLSPFGGNSRSRNHNAPKQRIAAATRGAQSHGGKLDSLRFIPYTLPTPSQKSNF